MRIKLSKELQLELLLRLIGGFKEMGNFRKALRISTIIPLLVDTLETYMAGREAMREFKENLAKAASGQQDYVIKAGSFEAQQLWDITRKIDDFVNSAERRLKR